MDGTNDTPLTSKISTMFTNDIQVVISENNATDNYKIEIGLSDKCGNGHEDFAITGTFWEPGKVRSDRNLITAGCCHDEILRIRPDLKPFVALHQHDFSGTPMYPVEDGFFNLKLYEAEEFCAYFHCTKLQWDGLSRAEDATHFWYLLTLSKIPAQWKEMATHATALLEQMSGQKFQSRAASSHFVPMSDLLLSEMVERVQSGYYEDSAIRGRDGMRKNEEIAARMSEVAELLQRDVTKAKQQFEVAKFILDVTKNVSTNFIFYSHNQTLRLNWLAYSAMFTPEQVRAVKVRVGELSFPVIVKVGPA